MASEQSHVPPVTFDYLANPTTYLHVHCGAAGNQAGGAPATGNPEAAPAEDGKQSSADGHQLMGLSCVPSSLTSSGTLRPDPGPSTRRRRRQFPTQTKLPGARRASSSH